METATKSRKKRNDRTHAIYEIIVAGQSYIGLTDKTKSTIKKSVELRFAKHAERARNESKPWPLYSALRKHGIECVDLFILETVRGKKNAHFRECELIKILKLNYQTKIFRE